MRGPRFRVAGRGEDGQAVVELAIVLLVLMTLVLGAFEIGRMVNAWAIVTQASREGARTGAVMCTMNSGCSTNVQASVEGSLFGMAGADWFMDPGPYQAGNPFTVRVELEIVPITPLIAGILPGGAVTVVGETTMRLE
jgi:hypothetical protein